MVRIISVCSGKGGVGKTTVTANLGVALQKFNKKVAVIDFNFTTPHLSLYFDMYSYPVTLNSFLRNEAKLENAIYNHASGLSVVPASLHLDKIVNIDVNNLKNTLKDVFSDYDLVFIDSAPGLGKEAMIALEASDEVLFVANPHVPSMVDIEKCKQVINILSSKPIPMGVIVNKVRNKSYEIKMEEIKHFTQLPIIGIVPEDENVLADFNRKTLVTFSKKNSSASKAFYKIAARIVGVKYDDGFFAKFKGLFGRKK
ncbi:MAG: cell division ATPase MinD [Candidatus Aenigmatarchaeota archaeon]